MRGASAKRSWKVGRFALKGILWNPERFFKSKFENQIVDMKNEFKGKGLDHRSF